MYPGLQGTTETDSPAKMVIHTASWKQIGQQAKRTDCKRPLNARAKLSPAVPRWT